VTATTIGKDLKLAGLKSAKSGHRLGEGVFCCGSKLGGLVLAVGLSLNMIMSLDPYLVFLAA